MIKDAPRVKELQLDEDGNPIDENQQSIPELSTKEDIKNYLKGIM